MFFDPHAEHFRWRRPRPGTGVVAGNDNDPGSTSTSRPQAVQYTHNSLPLRIRSPSVTGVNGNIPKLITEHPPHKANELLLNMPLRVGKLWSQIDRVLAVPPFAVVTTVNAGGRLLCDCWSSARKSQVSLRH